MTIQHAIKHARFVNHMLVEHKRAGRIFEATYCARLRGEWMAAARARA